MFAAKSLALGYLNTVDAVEKLLTYYMLCLVRTCWRRNESVE